MSVGRAQNWSWEVQMGTSAHSASHKYMPWHRSFWHNTLACHFMQGAALRRSVTDSLLFLVFIANGVRSAPVHVIAQRALWVLHFHLVTPSHKYTEPQSKT